MPSDDRRCWRCQEPADPESASPTCPACLQARDARRTGRPGPDRIQHQRLSRPDLDQARRSIDSQRGTP